jgi:undecaprenyl pyrophosphate phosphatase UppP
MRRSRSALLFALANVGVWIVMMVVLVLVPDTLERWLPLEVSRVLGWVMATGLWMILVEREWQRRVRPLPRYAMQVLLWMSAAFVALWISEHARVGG